VLGLEHADEGLLAATLSEGMRHLSGLEHAGDLHNHPANLGSSLRPAGASFEQTIRGSEPRSLVSAVLDPEHSRLAVNGASMLLAVLQSRPTADSEAFTPAPANARFDGHRRDGSLSSSRVSERDLAPGQDFRVRGASKDQDRLPAQTEDLNLATSESVSAGAAHFWLWLEGRAAVAVPAAADSGEFVSSPAAPVEAIPAPEEVASPQEQGSLSTAEPLTEGSRIPGGITPLWALAGVAGLVATMVRVDGTERRQQSPRLTPPERR
jgi:hypothetical protein